MANQEWQPPLADDPEDQATTANTEASAASASAGHETTNQQQPGGPGDLLSMSEQAAGKRFARDINAKIDEVEGQVRFLVDAFARSQQALKGVMGDVKSQTALVTTEIERVTGLVDKASGEQTQRLSALDQRLKETVAQLKGQLASVDDQLHAHQDDIGLLKTELDESHTRLAERIQGLAAETQRKIDMLVRRDKQQGDELAALAQDSQRGFEDSRREREALNAAQQAQHDRQQTMAGHLEALQEQADTQGDDLAELGTTVADHHAENRRHHRIFAAICATVVVLFVGVLTYLEMRPSTETGQLQARVGGLESQVADLETQVQAAEASTGTVDELATKVTGLETQVTSLESELQAGIAESESLEDIASKVAALELSLYGPPGAELPATPVLTIEDVNWVAARNPSHYSIQLVGAYREGSVVAYTNQHAEALGDHPLSLTQSEYRGRSWYNLFYGDFASFDAALAALDALPPSLQRNGPWIRKLASIQQSALR